MDFMSVQKCVPVDSKYKEKEMLYIQGFKFSLRDH